MAPIGILFAIAIASLQNTGHYFKIQVIDESTGRGVPLVQLRTVSKQRFYTDSNGIVAFDEPGLMERRVYFSVESQGYEYPADGFGYRGLALFTHKGGSAQIKLKRLNIAERICRLTGQGIYRDSELVGESAPIANSNIDGDVMGQDTAQAEIYKGRMIWFWGDTDRPDYPLGNFHTSGAYAQFPKGHDSADAGLEFRYFMGPDGFVRPMVPNPDTHPIWISGLVVMGDELYAYYAQMASLGQIMESGYLRWNDSTQQFNYMKRFDADNGWRFLDGHTIRFEDSGKSYAEGHFPPTVRVPADRNDLLSPASYEAYGCLDKNGAVERDGGKPQYRWRKGVPPITPDVERGLVEKGLLRANEAHFLPHDVSGETIFPHNGSVHWNAYRKKWIAIFTRLGGKDSELGEVYYSEADAPTGPFNRAVKVATHRNYSFYNPVQHPFLDGEGGRIVYFEGTYTAEFSGNSERTPLYDYNQILYRLDLSDPRLAFAEAMP